MFRLVLISCVAFPKVQYQGLCFFLLYINDIINTSTVLQLILFADDTNVFVPHKDKDCLTNVLNAELNKLSLWFRANRLSLNLKKKQLIHVLPSKPYSTVKKSL